MNNATEYKTPLQTVIDIGFENAFQLALKKNTQLPIWLFELYNSYLRVNSKKEKNKVVLFGIHLKISKELFYKTYKELGIKAARNLYSTKILSNAA